MDVINILITYVIINKFNPWETNAIDDLNLHIDCFHVHGYRSSRQRQEQGAKMVRYTEQKHFFYIKKLFNLKLNYSMKVSIHYIIQGF